MRPSRLLAAALAFSATLSGAGYAQRIPPPATEGGEEIAIDAEQISYDQKTDTVIARGQVVIRRGETELRANEVRINRTTNEAEARGHVSITDPEGTILAEAVHLNLDEETGVLEGAEVRSRRFQYSLWGERVEKGLGQSYRIENGRFTTCHCTEGPPSWSVAGKDLQVAMGGYGKLRGGTFNVLDVPVLYVPRALFPVQQERQTGFLMPRFGASNRRGFQTLLPFYWVINKSHDATLAVDIESKARLGVVGEYRYAVSRETRGIFSASYFNESFRGTTLGKPFETTIPQDRWSMVGEHDQPLVGDIRLYGDAFVVSDDLFLREINTYAFEHAHAVAIRTLPFTESRVGVVQLWDRIAVKGEGTYYQSLTGHEAQTLQRAPEVTLWGQGRLSENVLGELKAAAVDFQRGHGVDGFRLDIEPAATLPLPFGRVAFGALRASVRETAYHLTDRAVTQTGRDLPRDQSRESFELSAEVGSALQRVYPLRWFGLEKVKHTIEPGLAYLYVPAVSQGDLPLLDGVDRLNHRSLVTYGLVSRFLGKFDEDRETPGTDAAPSSEPRDGAVRELGRLSLSQSVDMLREIDPLQTGRAADHFSDVDLGGRVNPSRSLSVRFHTNYDTGNNNISAARVGFFIEDSRQFGSAGGPTSRLDTRTSAGVSYRFLTQNLLQEIDSNVVLRLADWVGFLYASRYDVVTDRFLDNFFGLRLISTCDCWAFDFAVTDRTNPQEVEVRAQLTLAGLGSSKPRHGTAVAP